jgi:two-component system response regulator FixJ
MYPVSGTTVYVIDDDDAIRDSLTLMLEIEGFAVRTFASCADFLRHARPVDGSCVVVDLEIRDTSGLELVEELQRGNLVSAIVMTGEPDGRMAHAVRRLDVPVVEKPFSGQELIRCIETIRWRGEAPE